MNSIYKMCTLKRNASFKEWLLYLVLLNGICSPGNFFQLLSIHTSTQLIALWNYAKEFWDQHFEYLSKYFLQSS